MSTSRLTDDDRDLIARSRTLGPILRAASGDRERLAGWLLKELADLAERLVKELADLAERLDAAGVVKFPPEMGESAP